MKRPGAASRKKQPFIVESIDEMARELGPGAKLPTAHQLAKTLGVTRATLDRSLAKLESRGVITRRQGSGIYVSPQINQKRIGLLFGRNIFQTGSSTFYLLLLQLCEERAKAGTEQFSFYLRQHTEPPNISSGIRNADLADSLKQGKLDGLLLCEINDPAYERTLHDFGIPAVSLAPSSIFPSVGIRTEKLIKDSVQALAEEGCRTVGLLGILAKHERLFRSQAEKANLEIDEAFVIHPEDESDPPFDAHEALGREWMHTCLDRCGGPEHLPDGLLITDDILARGALLHLKKLGDSSRRGYEGSEPRQQRFPRAGILAGPPHPRRVGPPADRRRKVPYAGNPNGRRRTFEKAPDHTASPAATGNKNLNGQPKYAAKRNRHHRRRGRWLLRGADRCRGRSGGKDHDLRTRAPVAR